MAKPIVIKVDLINGRIIFYSDFLYRELNEAIQPGRWDVLQPPGPGRTRPGAWNYPATLPVALQIHKSFEAIVKRDPDSWIDPEFNKLVESALVEKNLIVKITAEGIVLTMPFDPERIAVFKSVEGWAFKKNPPRWVYPFTPETVAQISRRFEENAWDLWNDAIIDPIFRALIPDPAANRPEIKTATTPRSYQKRAFWRAFEKPGFMLAHDMGAGKSKVAVDLAVNWEVKKILIVCPKAVMDVWPAQFRIHAAPGFNPMIAQLKGPEKVSSKAVQVERLLDFAALAGRPAIVIANYDIIYREPLRQVLIKAGFDLVIADESHKFKSPGGKISKFMSYLGKNCPRRLALTGTPMPQTPFDSYAQMRFVDTRCFGTSYADFLAEYANFTDIYGQPKGVKNLPKLNGRFYQFADRVKSGDVLDLPPVQHIEYYFDLAPAARRIYDDLAEKFQAEWESGSINVNNILTQILRLQQVTGGHLKNDETGQVEQIDDSKINLLRELLEELPEDEPAVIFCRFRADMDAAHSVAGIFQTRSLELSGRKNELAEWQNGAAPVLVVQIQSGGAGIDLTRACHCFYYSVGYSNGDYEQSLKRTDRPGQTRPVRFYHLLANGTIDIKIQKALAQRKRVVDMVLDFNKEEPELIAKA